MWYQWVMTRTVRKSLRCSTQTAVTLPEFLDGSRLKTDDVLIR